MPLEGSMLVQHVAIYARSSTSSQRARSTTESQIRACRQLAESRGATVLGVFVDEAISGSSSIGDRPSGARLLRLCETGAVDAIVVARVDRLSRRLEDLVLGLGTLTRTGAEIG